jgi:hypothetical protein
MTLAGRKKFINGQADVRIVLDVLFMRRTDGQTDRRTDGQPDE